jgi:hypothetical protein
LSGDVVTVHLTHLAGPDQDEPVLRLARELESNHRGRRIAVLIPQLIDVPWMGVA